MGNQDDGQDKTSLEDVVAKWALVTPKRRGQLMSEIKQLRRIAREARRKPVPEFSIARLSLAEGDTLVVKLTSWVPASTMEKIKALTQEKTGHERVLVLDPGADLAVLEAPKNHPADPQMEAFHARSDARLRELAGELHSIAGDLAAACGQTTDEPTGTELTA